MRHRRLFCSVLLPAAIAVAPAAPWHHPLSLANHGHWPLRVPVQIENRSSEAVAGEPVLLSVPGLTGARAESVRVCTAEGQELLFDVRDANGGPRRTGAMQTGDRLVVPAVCAANGSTTLFVYAGNEQAWPVPDLLKFGLVNGGFETGMEEPEGWTTGAADALHVVSWERDGGRNGGRCGKTEVAPGAPPTWPQWRQSRIPVVPGRSYRIRAWVRAEQVVGQAGWFVHVEGEGGKPQLLSQIAQAGAGTYDWKQVILDFTAPTTARFATVGTVLHGTGRAWFDDAEWMEPDGKPRLQASAGEVERLPLEFSPAAAASFTAEWPVRADVRVLNPEARATGPALVHVDLRPALGRLRPLPRDAALRVVEAATGAEVDSCVKVGSGLLFPVHLPPRTARQFYVYFSATQRQAEAGFLAGYERLLNSPLNLVPNPSFEQGEPVPEGWLRPESGRELKATGGSSSDARFGRQSAELTASGESTAGWVGWRSSALPVRPGATYLYSGFLKGRGLKGSATLHAHLHDAAGRLVASGAFVGTRPEISGDSDWVNSLTFVQAPPDAASIRLHLTMNTRGTLRHDGLLFCEVLRGEVVGLDKARPAGSATGLQAWPVNPLVKVFRDDQADVAVRAPVVECARNEFEPFQLALRSDRNLKQVRVSVSPLQNRQGETLPPVKVERVGFVPIDHPSGYFRSELPDWCRKVPQGAGMTDGWAGWWPDPLLPATPFDLERNQTEPLWLTVRAPREAPAGEYRGEVSIRAVGAEAMTLPLRVKVLPFTLPDRTRLKAIFDFRRGPGGSFERGTDPKEERRKWLRFMAERRLGIDRIEPAPVFAYQDGRVTMDTTGFDETARYCFEELGMNVAYTPSFFYAFGWAYPPKKCFGLEPFTPAYNRAFQQAYRLFTDHLRAKGWHDKFVYYISDEPHFRHPQIVEQMQKLCALAHEADPALPIYSSTWQHCPDWDKALDIWGVGQYGCFPVAELERLRRAGKQFWFTCDGQMATDTPYLATERMLPYYCFKYGASGFEFWGLSWWTYNPWERGWHTHIRQSSEGKDYFWVRYPNGDGYLAYPGRFVGVDGPVSTIRLEQVREGLEDYEALALLEELVRKAKSAGRSVAAAEAALTTARDLVTIPNAGGLRSTEILPEPDRLPTIRQAVNAAIVALSGEAP